MSCSCPSLPEVNFFYAKWINSDSVEFYYSVEEMSTSNGEHPIVNIMGHLYCSDSPDGPWEHISTDTLHAPFERDSVKFRHHAPHPDKVQFYRLNPEYVCSCETFLSSGIVIATRKPILHPNEMGSMPDLVSNVAEQTSNNGGTFISDDGTRLIAKHRGGRMFDLTTGKDITASFSENKILYIIGHGEWHDSLLYISGKQFWIYNAYTFEQLFYYNCSYSHKINDTCYITYDAEEQNYLHYNTANNTSYSSNSLYAEHPTLQYTTSSRSHKYVSSFRQDANTPRPGDFIILDSNYSLISIVSPFAASTNRLNIRHTSAGGPFPFVRWINDDVLIFWSYWSGTLEVWCYSISTSDYAQLTGYSATLYPGLYTAGLLRSSDYDAMVSLDIVADYANNRLIFFFRKDAFSYAVRYIPMEMIW